MIVHGLMVIKERRLGWAGNFPQEQFYPNLGRTLRLNPESLILRPHNRWPEKNDDNFLEYVGLGQAARGLRVIISDRRGEPAKGVPVVVIAPVAGNVGEGRTNDEGVFEMSLDEDRVTVVATLPDGEMRAVVEMADQGVTTADFRSTHRIDGPLVSIFEFAFGGTGLAMMLASALTPGSTRTVLNLFGGSMITTAVVSAIRRRF